MTDEWEDFYEIAKSSGFNDQQSGIYADKKSAAALADRIDAIYDQERERRMTDG